MVNWGYWSTWDIESEHNPEDAGNINSMEIKCCAYGICNGMNKM